MAWLNLFKNDRKAEGDNQPLYKNVKVVFDEDVILKKGEPRSCSLEERFYQEWSANRYGFNSD